MELKAFLRILRHRWWVAAPVFLVTLGATILFTFAQPPIYESTATFIVRAASASQNDRDLVSALDTLSRRNEIASTFAEVATSRLMNDLATENLALSSEDRRGLSVHSQLVAGTNILEISAVGYNPDLAARFANAVGKGTLTYAQNLYEAFELTPLDEALPPASSISPNKPLNLVLGGMFGLILGAGLAFLVEYLRTPPSNAGHYSIMDDETGVYSKGYFMQRLRQEMSRSGRNKYPLSLALIDVAPRGTLDKASPAIRRDTLRRVAIALEASLRDEDIMARFDETVFAVLLPDVSGQLAVETVEGLQARLHLTSVELERNGIMLNVHSLAGIASLLNGAGPDELVAQARLALEDVETTAHGKVSLFSNGKHGD